MENNFGMCYFNAIYANSEGIFSAKHCSMSDSQILEGHCRVKCNLRVGTELAIHCWLVTIVLINKSYSVPNCGVILIPKTNDLVGYCFASRLNFID